MKDSVIFKYGNHVVFRIYKALKNGCMAQQASEGGIIQFLKTQTISSFVVHRL